MESSAQLSVVICTYNRAANLPECIGKLVQQEGIEDLHWEIAIVDNNSSDNTRTVVEQLATSSPIPVRYLFEGAQGLSHARNRGIQQTAGRYVVFIDDDILVTPGWLKSIFSTYQEHDCDAVGGRIHVDTALEIPRWILPDMYGFLGQQDFGEQAFRMDGIEQFPFGGNMSCQRRVFDRIGMFDTGLGRKGSGESREELFKGEETEFFRRLAKREGIIRYQPDALVHHRILPYQLKRKFFRTIHYNEGFQRAATDRGTVQRNLVGVPLYVFPQLARAVGRYLILSLRQGPDRAIRQQMTVGYFLGMIHGYAHRRTASKTSSA